MKFLLMLSFDVFKWHAESFGLEILPKFQWVCVLNFLMVIWKVTTYYKLISTHHISISVKELAIAVVGVLKHLINQVGVELQNSTFPD